MVPERGWGVVGDCGQVVQELHNNLPRIVENQQGLGRIAGQLACDHHGLEPQVIMFRWFRHWQLLCGTAPVWGGTAAMGCVGLCTVGPVPIHLNSRTKLGTGALKHNVLRYSVLISILGCHIKPSALAHCTLTIRTCVLASFQRHACQKYGPSRWRDWGRGVGTVVLVPSQLNSRTQRLERLYTPLLPDRVRDGTALRQSPSRPDAQGRACAEGCPRCRLSLGLEASSHLCDGPPMSGGPAIPRT